jgi:hypothetical protein
MLLIGDSRDRRQRESEISLRPWMEVVGAIALLLAANSLASAVVAWLLLIAAVALFADGVNHALGKSCGGMRDYKQ